jgi:peptidoglycan hydrolase-like protein with peptidoglycan-binding domain
MHPRPLGAFGQITFDGAQVWSDFAAGGAQGTTAAQSIQAALNQLGYGPLTVDGQFGAASLAAWARFATDNGTGDGSWPSQVGVLKLGDAVAAGGDPGGGPIILQHVEDGQIVPGAAPGGATTASSLTGMQIGLLVGAVAIVGALVLVSKHKKKEAGVGGSERVGEVRETHTETVRANRRRPRRS